MRRLSRQIGDRRGIDQRRVQQAVAQGRQIGVERGLIRAQHGKRSIGHQPGKVSFARAPCHRQLRP